MDAQSAGRGQPPIRWASIKGTVVDVVSSQPTAGAVVVLSEDGSATPTRTRTARTDALGRYWFDAVEPRVYRLRVISPGYRPYEVVVDITPGSDVRLSLGVTADPIPMEPVVSTGQSAAPFRRAWSDESTAHLTAREVWALRPRRSLSADSHELTEVDVAHAVTLGERDLFRALQRLPEVTTLSDYTAEVWMRGAPWGQTRVYFDGVPLVNPLHGLGAFSGVSPSVVGEVWTHSGVRSASVGEAAAGTIEIATRPGEGDGHVNSTVDLSLITGTVTLDQRKGENAWAIAARRTHLNVLETLDVPYNFWDVTGRADLDAGRLGKIEVSGITQRDRFIGGGIDASAEWGNSAARISLDTRITSRLRLRHTLASSRYNASVTNDVVGLGELTEIAFPETSETRLNHVSLTGNLLAPPVDGLPARWEAGYSIAFHGALAGGALVIPVPRPGEVNQPPSDADNFRVDAALANGAVWAERLFRLGDRTRVQSGVRIDVADEIGPASARIAPRVTMQVTATQDLQLSAGYGRSHQYTQALAPSGVRSRSLSSSYVWLLTDKKPPITTDIVTAGAEMWLPANWVASASTYARRSTNLAVPDPAPGPAYGRRAFVLGTNEAAGFELALRRMTGRWTAAIAYTLAASDMIVEGVRFRAPSDRRHVIDVSSALQLVSRLRGSAAMTAATGSPFTLVQHRPVPCPVAQPDCEPELVSWFESPNAQRSSTYASLDLELDWNDTFGKAETTVFVQLRNALGRENRIDYIGGAPACERGRCGPAVRLENRTEAGLPRLPVLGIRVRF